MDPERLSEPAPEEDSNPWLEGSLATNVTAYLLAGPLTFGGGAWLVNHFLWRQPWLLPVGVLLGMGLSLYVIWVRYGRA